MTLVPYSRTSLLGSQGQASPAAIQRLLERAAGPGLDYIRRKEERPDLPLFPIPPDMGRIIVSVCSYYANLGYRINHDVVAAQVTHESAGMQSLICRYKHNTSGYGAENDDPYGKASTFDSFEACIDMVVRHLIGYVYGSCPYRSSRFPILVQKGFAGKVKQFWELEQKYAYSKPEDYNATPINERYGAKLAEWSNELLRLEEEIAHPIMLRVALAAGHHNSSGGSPVEYDITDDLTEQYFLALKAQGVDVRCYTPDGPDDDDIPGDGNTGRDLYDSARTVVNWAQQGWKADLYIEIHTEGGPKVPGMFGIYPDWGSDVDAEARDILIPLMINKMTAATPITKRGSGLMSEKSTGVGGQGFRLGVFRATEEIRSFCTRIIIEHGAHDTSDLVYLRDPQIQQKLARAATEAILTFYSEPFNGWNDMPQPATPQSDELYFQETGFKVVAGFKGFYEKLQQTNLDGAPLSLLVLGYPTGNEYGVTLEGGSPGSLQTFERGVLLWDSRAPHPWDIVLLPISAYKERGIV